ncbi:MAG: Hpt domain-containing protein, partial [Betaproteobacteria bacterium]|nr:Hpt domain-containing protein [Betaproteobacteria bacterium]
MSAVADTTLLSWISAEVDQALNLVRSNIAKSASAPGEEAAWKVSPGHLHQVAGALRMVGLAGATKFCEALEASLSGEKSPDKLSAIDRAVLALKEFVNDLAHGKANVPLRLLPAYREIAPSPDAAERDLFFPDLSPIAPAHPAARELPPGELGPYLLAARTRYQRGMLGWLRGQAGLEDMRAAVDSLHQVASQLPEPRALWWAAGGLFDAFAASPEPQWAAASKPICNRIDLLMRDLAAGTHKGSEPLAREVLYAIAKAKPSSDRIRDIKRLYGLESLFPGADGAAVLELDMDRLEPALSDLRSRLDALKGVWLQYVSGEPRSVLRFRELVASFKEKAAELDNRQLVKLLDAIALVCAKLPDPHPAQKQFMVIEMASAFLLLESIIEHFATPADDLEQQIGILGGWLLDAAQGKSTGAVPPGLRSELSREIGAMQLRAQVAKEILANLHHTEQVLDAFARDPSKRDTLEGLEPFLRQIHGALKVLGFERPADVLSICQTMIATLAVADHPQAAQDLDWIAEGLSSLGFFLDPCLRGAPPAEQAIKLFFRRYEQRAQAGAPSSEQEPVIPDLVLDDGPSEPSAIDFAATIVASAAVPVAESAAPQAPAAPAHTPAEPSRPPVNQELLEIYLDEAGEVLGTINAALPECRDQPNNRDAITTIRRAFHTLKGSGRMVGLMDLGEVAWEIEQVMNRWLEQQRPATKTLLELIAQASGAFAGWVEQLRAGTLQGEIDARAIVELARKLKSGEITEPPVEAAPPAEPDEVIIGDVRLSRAMFDIYMQEAQGHVATLEDQVRRWGEAPQAETPHEFLRAAHTLASSSRTAGFTTIADLAGAVEQWVPFATHVAEATDRQRVQAAVQHLRRMVESVLRREAPARAPDITQNLIDLTQRLQALPVPAPAPEASLAIDLSAIDLDLGAATVVVDTKKEKEAAKPVEKTPAIVVEQAASAAFAPAAAAPTGRELRKMHDDIDEQLLPIFLEEAQELLPQIGSDIRDWKANAGDMTIVHSLQRALHTLKGSARMAGAIRLGELTHIMESRIEVALETAEVTPALFAELEEKLDRLSLDLERMQSPAAAEPAA